MLGPRLHQIRAPLRDQQKRWRLSNKDYNKQIQLLDTLRILGESALGAARLERLSVNFSTNYQVHERPKCPIRRLKKLTFRVRFKSYRVIIDRLIYSVNFARMVSLEWLNLDNWRFYLKWRLLNQPTLRLWASLLNDSHLDLIPFGAKTTPKAR